MDETRAVRRVGYLHGRYHYFHLRDREGQERDFHFHDFDKVVILLSGRVEYEIEDASYLLRPWDILLIKHHAIHRANIDVCVPYDRVILYLDGGQIGRLLPEAGLMECFDRADRRGQYLVTPGEEERARLEELMRRFEEAQTDEGFGAEAMRTALLLQILVCLGRIAPPPVRAAEITAVPDDKITQVLSYINEHLTEPLTVDALAERAYLSKYHFMRLFKSQTGSTVHEYILQKRLLNAAKLIRHETPAGRAAMESGFADYSAFYRAFRKTFGVRPTAVRRGP